MDNKSTHYERRSSIVSTSSLPVQPTSFVGRVDELADIANLLTEPTCRLLTLIGPGGIGKTRLAIRVAEEMHHHFADGVWFAALQPVDSSDFLVSALADALHLSFYGPEDPRIQLLHQLQPKELLLVVDNFEHLLDGVDLLTAIVQTAPRVKLLVTSRELLNVREEWVREVRSLRVPTDRQDVDVGSYDAIQLFVARARQACGEFSFNHESAYVIRICQLVDGIPLAIELAAARVRTLSCEQIAMDLAHNMDVLMTMLRNVPERHRDMYAVFEPCWTRLTQSQRDVFMRLSVFRGGFTRTAAEHVADASLEMLATLVDKSLLRIVPVGRYEMHELVRQYAEARLDELPDRGKRTRDHHCQYFADLLQRLEPDMKSSGQLVALSTIEVEIDNMRTAWRWAVGHRMEREIEKSLDSLALFYHIRCWYQEAEEALRMAIDGLGHTRSVVRGRALLCWCLCRWSLGNLSYVDSAGRQGLWEGMSILRTLDAYGETAMPLWVLSEFDDDPERYSDIEQFCQDNLAAFRIRDDNWGMAWALIGLANVSLLRWEYDEARAHSQEALALFGAIGDQLGMASALHSLIKVAHGQGMHEEEKRYGQEALELAMAIDDRGGIFAAQLVIGRAAYNLGVYEEAKQWIERGLAIHRELLGLRNPGPIDLLGAVTLALGNRRQASRYMVQALQSALDESFCAFCALIAVARYRIAENQYEQAVELLSLVTSFLCGHRHSNHAAARRLLADLENALPPEVFAAARRRGAERDLKTVIAALVNELAMSGTDTDSTQVPETGHGKTLTESLSAREMEVLQLVADGLSNREIAQRLVVTVGTVKKHLNNIFSKLQVRSRTEAAARARELGLLP